MIMLLKACEVEEKYVLKKNSVAKDFPTMKNVHILNNLSNIFDRLAKGSKSIKCQTGPDLMEIEDQEQFVQDFTYFKNL